MTDPVVVRELGPREGFQILPRVVPTPDKLELIRALVAAKLNEIEVTSFVRADRVPQLADCAEVVAQLGSPPPGVSYRALCLNAKGFVRSLEFKNLAHPAWLYTGASDVFLQSNANTSFAKQLDSIATEWAPVWRAQNLTDVHVMISNSWGCAYEGSIAPAVVVARWRQIEQTLQALSFRCVELSLADTVGHATAAGMKALITALRDAGGVPALSLHLHDTRGRALECVEEGLRFGVRIFESSVVGLGGCPFTPGAAGNVSTEQLVACCHRSGLITQVDERALQAAADIARRLAPEAARST